MNYMRGNLNACKYLQHLVRVERQEGLGGIFTSQSNDGQLTSRMMLEPRAADRGAISTERVSQYEQLLDETNPFDRNVIACLFADGHVAGLRDQREHEPDVVHFAAHDDPTVLGRVVSTDLVKCELTMRGLLDSATDG